MKTIYYNGNIITMDEDFPKASSILIENGYIKKVSLDKIKEDNAQYIDLQGHCMMPGFIDGHSHFVGFANSLSQCDLSQAKNFKDIIQLMKDFIKENSIENNEIVIGCNYDHNFLKEKKHPDKFVLNEISFDHPIMIIHASSHMGVVNDYLLNQEQIDEKTADPIGGRYGRVEGTLIPNGYMEENAFITFQNKVSTFNPQQLLKLMSKAQDIYASYGITTIQDGMVNNDLFQLLRYASQNHLLKLDVVSYIDLAHCRDTLLNHQDYLHSYQQHLKIGGYKIFLDGSPQGKTAWMSEPYITGENGYPTLTDDQLYAFISMASEDHQQLLAHCNGDQAAQQYITQFEKYQKRHPHINTHRPVMVHAQLVRSDQLKRMPPLHMIPSFFIAHTYYWGDIHLQNFGQERGNHISPAKSASLLHLPFTFHQDTPVLLPDMLKTIWCAVNRQTKNGVDLGDDEKISVYDALKAITIHGAYQYFEEETKGSLTPNKLADLVILDNNPLTCDLSQIDHIQVLETIKEGKTIYKRIKA